MFAVLALMVKNVSQVIAVPLPPAKSVMVARIVGSIKYAVWALVALALAVLLINVAL